MYNKKIKILLFIVIVIISHSLFSCLSIGLWLDNDSEFQNVAFIAGPNQEDLHLKVMGRNKKIIYEGSVPVELQLKAGGFLHKKIYTIELSRDDSPPLVVELKNKTAWREYFLGNAVLSLTVIGVLGFWIDPITGAIYKWGQPKVTQGNGEAYGGVVSSTNKVIINMYYYEHVSNQEKNNSYSSDTL